MAKRSRVQAKLDEADEIIAEQAELLDEQLIKIAVMLRPYEKLKERENRLRAARRALVGTGNRTTGEGGDKLTSDEVAAFLAENPGSKPGDIAKHFGIAQPTVSSHLYRGKGERFLTKDDGTKRWWLRNPKNGIDTADDIEEEDE